MNKEQSKTFIFIYIYIKKKLLNFLKGPVRVCEENPDSTQTAEYAKAIFDKFD